MNASGSRHNVNRSIGFLEGGIPLKKMGNVWKHWEIYLMLLPTIVYLSIFTYYPVLKGIEISLMDFRFVGNSEFIGFDNYARIFQDSEFYRAFGNTIVFALWNTILGVVLPAGLAILLNEIKHTGFQRTIQTIIYLPNLFSWVVIGTIFFFLLSPTVGPVNVLIKALGGEPIYFFGNTDWAKPLYIFINQWKSAGFGLIIFLASIVSIDLSLYEAAKIDGASRVQRIFYITIPSLFNTFKVVLMLNVMGMMLLFDQIYVMSNPVVKENVDVIMTYLYRVGITRLDLGFGAAASMIILVITLAFTILVMRLTKFGTEQSD